VFYDLINEGVHLQVMCSQKRYGTHSLQTSNNSSIDTIQRSSEEKNSDNCENENEDEFTFMNRILKRGDIIGNLVPIHRHLRFFSFLYISLCL
jgi:hypothetical protein